MYAEDHAGHTTCATPGCAAFHLFCPTCGGRRHVQDMPEAHQPQPEPQLSGQQVAGQQLPAAPERQPERQPLRAQPLQSSQGSQSGQSSQSGQRSQRIEVARNSVPAPVTVSGRPAAAKTA